MDIQKVRKDDENFPILLKEIPLPPNEIYIKGEFSQKDLVAIVGTRKATPEGKRAAYKFSGSLVKAGIGIVSGLALGIDASAHDGALSENGYTLAVLAHGLNSVYPATNRPLAKRILETGGALMSEYAPEIEARDYRFLERNRIISGLCRAILVIEAPDRSGSLATARFGLEQNRDIYVFPGPGGHPNYRGSHRLIRDGATLVDKPEDLLQDLGLEAQLGQEIYRELPPEARVILSLLRGSLRPLSIDEILEKATLTPPAVHQAMTFLIVNGLAGEEAGGYTNVV